MMNEFPGHYKSAWHGLGTEGVVGLNGTEYLELLGSSGISENDFDPIQPLHQQALWSRIPGEPSPERVAQAIEAARKADHRFHMEGGSWTSDLSWIKGYESVLGPIQALSAKFHRTTDGKADPRSHRYRNALFHLLVAETSCYRYWGQGRFTEFAKEFCRRGNDILTHDFA